MRNMLLALLLVAFGCSDWQMEAEYPIGRVIIEPDSLLLLEGTEAEVQVRVLNTIGEVIAVPDWYEIEWMTSDESAASVDAGVVVAGHGKATITATVAGRRANMKVFSNPILDLRAYTVYINQGDPGAPGRSHTSTR